MVIRSFATTTGERDAELARPRGPLRRSDAERLEFLKNVSIESRCAARNRGGGPSSGAAAGVRRNRVRRDHNGVQLDSILIDQAEFGKAVRQARASHFDLPVVPTRDNCRLSTA